MYRLELNDIMFFVSSLKNPSPHFDISDYFYFCNHSISTRSSTSSKLQHSLPPSSQLRHSFFHRLPILWNALPVIDLNRPISYIKKLLVTDHLIIHFITHFDSENHCSFHFICPCNTIVLVPNFLLLPLALLNLLFIFPWVLIQVIIIPSVLSLSLYVLSPPALYGL